MVSALQNIERSLPGDRFKLQISEIEVGQLNSTLPVGIFTEDGDKLREYKLLPYIGRHDLDLGRLEDDNREHPHRVNRIYASFLPTLIDCFEDWPIKDLASYLKLPLPRLIDRMFLADVLAICIGARLKNQGSNLAIACRCPSCGFAINSRKSEEPSYHDLSTIKMRVWGGESPPLLRVDLRTAFEWEGEVVGAVYFEPLRFRDARSLKEPSLFPADVQLIMATGKIFFRRCLNPIPEQVYYQMDRRDARALEKAVSLLYLGPERTIEMDCPACAARWSQLLTYGKGYEEFYASLLSAPRIKDAPGAVEEYLNEVDFFFSVGEQAPRKDVFAMTPASREFWLKKMSEMYKKQKEEMDKASAKAKAKKR